ncbi:MAG: hypothetical protein DMF81_19115 [Acidobacteria bacterium]|nr:MAG: hypothetical protein DMF81_19115 [Acidobacteriota bacterium]
MLLKIGVVLAAIPVTLGAVVAGTGVMVVDVKDSDGTRIVVPVPFDLARQALRQARDGRVSPADLVAAPRRARLTRLADVRDGGDHVRITIW